MRFLSYARDLTDLLGAAEHGRRHEQDGAIRTTQDAGEAEAVELDGLQDSPLLANAEAAIAGSGPEGADRDYAGVPSGGR